MSAQELKPEPEPNLDQMLSDEQFKEIGREFADQYEQAMTEPAK